MLNFRLSIIILCVLIGFQACNKGLIDFEDNFNIKYPDTTNNNIIISSQKPKRIDYYQSYPSNPSKFTEIKFNYYYLFGKLENIALESFIDAYFSYKLDTFNYYTIRHDTFTAIIKNNRIEIANPKGFQFRYYYDSNGYLIKLVNDLDSTFYSYKDGNLIEKTEYTFFDEVTRTGTRKIKTTYEYYDSIFVNDNEYLFTYNEHRSVTFSDLYYYSRYLDIFGKHNKNIIKTKTIYDSFFNSTYSYTYHWDIQGALIKGLLIKNGESIMDKTIFKYE